MTASKLSLTFNWIYCVKHVCETNEKKFNKWDINWQRDTVILNPLRFVCPWTSLNMKRFDCGHIQTEECAALFEFQMRCWLIFLRECVQEGIHVGGCTPCFKHHQNQIKIHSLLSYTYTWIHPAHKLSLLHRDVVLGRMQRSPCRKQAALTNWSLFFLLTEVNAVSCARVTDSAKAQRDKAIYF